MSLCATGAVVSQTLLGSCNPGTGSNLLNSKQVPTQMMQRSCFVLSYSTSRMIKNAVDLQPYGSTFKTLVRSYELLHRADHTECPTSLRLKGCTGRQTPTVGAMQQVHRKPVTTFSQLLTPTHFSRAGVITLRLPRQSRQADC